MLGDKALLCKAIEAQQRVYAPYSNFPVSAALLTKSGRVFCGVNVENVSYGLSVCAERTAIFSAIIAGERDFVKLAIVCNCESGCLPCGACRQVIAEFAPSLPLLLGTVQGDCRTVSLSTLLPQPFLPDHLPE